MKNLLRFAKPRRHADESVVQNNLAYTPSQMMELAEKGIPINQGNIGADNFFDGVPIGEGTFDLPLERQKGVDVADCWQAAQSIRKKAKNGLKLDIKQYGQNPLVEQKGGD